MSGPQDPAFGVKAFSIAGRTRYERERLKGMTETERQWRAQWVKDQELSHNEPRNVPEFYKATNNFFRRLYKTPLYAFQCLLEPSLGYQNAYYVRQTVGKSLLLLYSSWVCYYIYKYYSNDFTRSKTIEVWITRRALYPDHPDFPDYQKFIDRDYYDQGFYSSPLNTKAVYVPRPTRTKPGPPKPPRPALRADGTEIICPKPDIEFYTP